MSAHVSAHQRGYDYLMDASAFGNAKKSRTLGQFFLPRKCWWSTTGQRQSPPTKRHAKKLISPVNFRVDLARKWLLMQRLEAKIWEITGRNSPPCPPAPIARVISNLGWLLLYQNKPPNDLWKKYLMGGFTPIKTWGEVVVIHPERMFEGSHWKLVTIAFWWDGWET